MFSENIVSFVVIVAVQLMFFVTHAIIVGKKEEILGFLWRGILIGLPFGIAFDLVVGKYIGIFDYKNGFDMYFLIVNGLLSYGVMFANIFLLQSYTVIKTFFWAIGLGLVYEITNYFFPVWEWTFGSTYYEYFVVIFAAYAGLAWLKMLTIRIFYRTKFLLIPF